MDIGQIEAFIQVANYKSFSRAAQAIHLTQPSITARIQALERDLDEELFERHGRRLLLTDAGKAFLPYARQVLKTIQEGRDAVAEVAGLKAGSLQLGVLPTIGSYLLPRLLLDFGGRYPNIDVAVFNRPNEQILQLVLSDQVHLGILRPQNHPDIENIPLFDDEIILVVHPGHPFVKAEKVTFQGLARERLV
ncbi:MAG TPA: LysR substrate-binding domain-containing protein, partial [Dehalococcoidia bacterium]|nr:LysR substrate-binding domain-containing protein [Dehalococcoidia bacterium]